MAAYIHGIGTSVPTFVNDRAEALAVAKILSKPYLSEVEWLDKVYEQSGVQTRHQVLGRGLVDDILNGTELSDSPFIPLRTHGPTTAQRMGIYTKEAPPLAVDASRKALENSKISPDSIAHLTTVSCTGFVAPGIDHALRNQLNLKASVERTHVGFMGCHAAINGLRVANAYASRDAETPVLMTAVELCTVHYYFGSDLDKLVANALFGDGAASVVVSGKPSPVRIVATGSCCLPDSDREMAWRVGDHGFQMTLTKRIPQTIAKGLRGWLEPWLESQGSSMSAIRNWMVHPGGPRILDAVESSLNLQAKDLEISRDVLSRHGNMSSPTVLFILQEFLKRERTGPSLMLAFGPGLTAEAALLEVG
jgi:alpha-pyrone synthase